MDIRAEREAAGLTQAALARAASVPQPNLSAYENGRRTPSAEVLERLREALRVRPSSRIARHRESLRDVVEKHRAANPRLFGSIARGEDGLDSDVDLLVDFAEDAGLFDEIALRLDLTELLGARVDVVGSDSLHGAFKARVLAEAVDL
ncbi:hypothetical protein BH708_16330 [Brachybacterium sp. P6-10-X1]|uniref:helix-turn-helix domain-containing protein n=1 Tax=Brachybacterium sp. P6-10-X1 TaxID=1903186 RepID=UPI000971BCA6|nr:helix-turn-helix domain-containing protein [Brachybacterium sp. P6-10-X1]APX34019.1 hypothetical protein BH708_16330 [Brachybacterium sp. P6-10-X1]